MLFRTTIFIILFLVNGVVEAKIKKPSGESPKKILAVKISQPPRIDGKLDDKIWKSAEADDRFFQYTPVNGGAASQKTEVRVLYDNTAIYIGATLYDSSPDSIFTELGERDADRDLNADHFSIDINPFADGVNGTTFKVSASGVQTDIKRVGSESEYRGRDTNWDAVWQSNVALNDNGWSVEMKLPYSALRFPKAEEQSWDINFWREIRRNREWVSWNFVDREVGNSLVHMGELVGLKEIKPPLRLSISPYVSGYIEKSSDQQGWGTSYNGGADIKYGINESFTLDATLVPDFGQVQSDDEILNLSPFEVKYNEKRQFFTEGTELFNKGGIFYSRRVGSKPRGISNAEDDLTPNEIILNNPAETRLINASKISGRTNSGLGIGFFNAMTARSAATIRDNESGGEREVVTQPFTNYNLVVLDQSLWDNSYISLINTNVSHKGPNIDEYYTANVTGTDFKLSTRDNFYTVNGKGLVSQKYYDNQDADLGFSTELFVGKTGGRFRYDYRQVILSDTYDPNDMGYIRRNNQFSNGIGLSYNTYEPFWKILSTRSSLSFNYRMLYRPRVYTELDIQMRSHITFKNYFTIGFRANIKPMGTDDYFESRVGRVFKRDKSASGSLFMSTNYTKMVAGRLSLNFGNMSFRDNQKMIGIQLSPRIQVNDRLRLSHEFSYRRTLNSIGYITSYNEDSVYFGKRLSTSITNTFNSTFMFNSRSSLSLRLRHYWSRADYDNEFFLLDQEGYLEPADYTDNEDINFNTLNLDMVYTWRFAPGSEMSLVWKNSILQYGDEIFYDFLENFNQTLESSQLNSISLKVLYYLDYQYLKRKSQ